MSQTRDLLGKLGFDLDAEKRAVRAGAYNKLRAGEAIEVAAPLDSNEEKTAIRIAAYYNIYQPEEAIKLFKQSRANEVVAQTQATSAWVATPEVDEINRASTASPRPGTW